MEAAAVSLPAAQPTFMFKTVTDHPIGGEVTIFAPCGMRSTATTVEVQTPAPQYGTHSREVLQDVLGFSAEAVEGFVASGAVGDQWSTAYIPGGDPWAKQAKEYLAYVQKADDMTIAAAAAQEAITHEATAQDAKAALGTPAVAVGTAKVTSGALVEVKLKAVVGGCGATSEEESPRLLPTTNDPLADLAPHRSTHTYSVFGGGTMDCSVCLQELDEASDNCLSLRCGHRFCAPCLQRCSEAGLSACPTCRHPHELSPEVLAARAEAFRLGYKNWRRGSAKGARGEVDDITAVEAQL
jgi:hypothetical protein